MQDDKSVELLARWRAGDQQAAADLFHRYAERLIAVAHRRLSAKLAQRVHAEDVVQSVYCSFFVGARDGRYVLERSGDLWRLLVTITLNKLQHHYKRNSAEKRALDREQADGNAGVPLDVLAREPTPEEAAILVDVLEHLLQGLDPVQRRMIELRLQGFGLEEIAAQTQRCRQTVRRILDRVLRQLESDTSK
jgi:RNA polymerase sigma factor (sigma-70 family)